MISDSSTKLPANTVCSQRRDPRLVRSCAAAGESTALVVIALIDLRVWIRQWTRAADTQTRARWRTVTGSED